MVLQNLFRQISNPWPPRTRPHHTQTKLRLMKKQTVSSCCPDESSTDIVILSLLPAHNALCLVGQQSEKIYSPPLPYALPFAPSGCPWRGYSLNPPRAHTTPRVAPGPTWDPPGPDRSDWLTSAGRTGHSGCTNNCVLWWGTVGGRRQLPRVTRSCAVTLHDLAAAARHCPQDCTRNHLMNTQCPYSFDWVL